MEYLDRNENNFNLSSKVLDAIKAFDPKTLCFYTRIYGSGVKSVVTERISELYNIPEKQILLGYGGEDILKDAIHYFLMQGQNKKIIIPEFSWGYYKSIVTECGGSYEIYPIHEVGDTFSYDVNEIVEYSNRINPKILLIASPNNPTGNGLTPDELKWIMMNSSKDTMVLVDEAYSSFITSNNEYVSSLVNDFPNLLLVRTFSKFYGLPGLRLGFAFIGRGDNHNEFIAYTDKYLGFNRFSEAVALAALESEEHYRNVAGEMESGRRMLKDALGSLHGFKVYDSSANFVLIRYPIELKEALKHFFACRCIQIKFMEDDGLSDCMRITLGRKEQMQDVAQTIINVSRNAY